ncbi:MAG: hypothetical protein KDA21_11645 [Phycisphaerales bacterium]|nr:hypothetical protein [Phycisphaerales bacterium]
MRKWLLVAGALNGAAMIACVLSCLSALSWNVKARQSVMGEAAMGWMEASREAGMLSWESEDEKAAIWVSLMEMQREGAGRQASSAGQFPGHCPPGADPLEFRDSRLLHQGARKAEPSSRASRLNGACPDFCSSRRDPVLVSKGPSTGGRFR